MPCAPHLGHRPWPLVHSTAVRCLSQTLLHTRGSCRAVGGLGASPPQTEGVSGVGTRGHWAARGLGPFSFSYFSRYQFVVNLTEDKTGEGVEKWEVLFSAGGSGNWYNPSEDIPALTPNTDKSRPSTSAPLYSPGRPVQESIRG